MGLDMWLNDSEGNELIYWRKANQFHKWFMDNKQTGDDEGNGFITIEQLKELLNIINSILGETPKEKLCNHLTNEGFDVDKAKELLPTQSGFFFGGTDYDKYYVEDLIMTKKFLEEYFLSNPKKNVLYSSSW